MPEDKQEQGGAAFFLQRIGCFLMLVATAPFWIIGLVVIWAAAATFLEAIGDAIKHVLLGHG